MNPARNSISNAKSDALSRTALAAPFAPEQTRDANARALPPGMGGGHRTLLPRWPPSAVTQQQGMIMSAAGQRQRRRTCRTAAQHAR